jgi:hypothetical protein
MFKEQRAKELQLENDSLIIYIPSTYSSYEVLRETDQMTDVRKKSKRPGLSVRILNN